MASKFQDRKRENYGLLRDYDVRRNYFLQAHRGLCEYVMGKVD